MAYRDFKPYVHQAELYDRFDELDTVIVATRTSSGKTRAALYSLFDRSIPAIFVYPTNELLMNQAHSIRLALKERECEVSIEPKDALVYDFEEVELETEKRDADAHLRLMYSSLISNVQEMQRYGPRLDALISVIRCEKKRTYLLTNFDIIYFLLQQRFEYYFTALQYLTDYQAIVIDEFHFYKGYELSNLLYGLYLLSAIKKENLKIIFLSATPSFELLEMMKKLFPSIQVINDHPESSTMPAEKCHTAAHKIELSFEQSSHMEAPEIIEKTFRDLVPEIQSARQKGHSSRLLTIPCVIIVNSPLEARKLAQSLRTIADPAGLTIGERHGLMSRYDRKKDVDVLVGTSSIEVGIDFDTSLLIFEANEHASFIQRLGRAGRHDPAKVIALVPGSVLQASKTYQGNSREGLVDRLSDSFEKTDKPLIEYARSTYGILPVDLAVRKFKDRLDHRVRMRIPQSRVETENIEEAKSSAMDAIVAFESKARELGVSTKLGTSEIDELYSDPITRGWFRQVEELPFRGDDLQVLVFDEQLARLGATPIYFAPLHTVLRRCDISLEDLSEIESKQQTLLNDTTREDIRRWRHSCRRKITEAESQEIRVFKLRSYAKWNDYHFDFYEPPPFNRILVSHDNNLRIYSKDFDAGVGDYLSTLLNDELYLVTEKDLGLPWRVVTHKARGDLDVYLGSSALVARSYLDNQNQSQTT